MGDRLEEKRAPAINRDCTERIVVVHNGITENYLKLARRWQCCHEFKTETDTEIVAHQEHLKDGVIA